MASDKNEVWVICTWCQGRGYTTNGYFETTCLKCRGKGGQLIAKENTPGEEQKSTSVGTPISDFIFGIQKPKKD
jgi:DnaJ-class molecular chaperone